MNRRQFITQTGQTALAPSLLGSLLYPAGAARAAEAAKHSLPGTRPEELEKLFATWTDGLLARQIGPEADRESAGALACPACGFIHGRGGDAVYPLLRRARISKDERFVDAAVRLFNWMSCMDDKDTGGWINNLKPLSTWNGITTFSLITLCEALHYHGDLLPAPVRQRMTERAVKAADFIAKRFPSVKDSPSNVNYPMTTGYSLALAAKVLNLPRHRDQAKRLIYDCLQTRFSPNDHLLFGEFHPQDQRSPRGRYGVDLGYNVEESLQALTLYALLENDPVVRAAAVKAWRSHLAFMLPDGAWDNSWGTRVAKWTWWGSRTSDGCEQALFALAGENPVFGAAAWRNLRLQKACTHDGLLHGGPDLAHHGLKPCIHHTFTHAKALAATLDMFPALPAADPKMRLPREIADGARDYADIGVVLTARAPWRATLGTGDATYSKDKAFHATGAAPGVIWHDAVGLLFVASLSDYLMVEPTNMVPLPDCGDEPLTLRIETRDGAKRWTNLYDTSAVLAHQDDGKRITAKSIVRLLAGGGSGADVAGACNLAYTFEREALTISAGIQDRRDARQPFTLVLPLVSRRGEEVKRLSDNAVAIIKPRGRVVVSSTAPLRLDRPERIFNHVPGFEALKLATDIPAGEVTVTVRVET